MIVREDHTKNGSWAWARLRERFGRDSGATSFTEVFQYGWPSEKPFENVWRDWVKKVSKLPSGSLSSQLTISRLSRHGQPELDNHLRGESTDGMARQSDSGRKITLHNLPSTVTTASGHHCFVDRCRSQSCGSQTHQRKDCWYKDATCKTRGKQGHLAKVCKSGNTQTPRQRSSKGTGRGSEKGSGKGKDKAKKRTPETCLCCGNERHKKSDSKFKTATCSNCGKVGHLRAVCRNRNTRD